MNTHSGPFFRRAALALLHLLIATISTLRGDETSTVFTDTDGDTYQVVLKGTGHVEITRVNTGGGNGPIDSLTVSGTTASSRLTVEVTAGGGDGKVGVASVEGATPLGSLKAPSASLTGSGINLPGGIGMVQVGAIGADSAVRSGATKKLPLLRLTSGAIGANLVIDSPGQSLLLSATSIGPGASITTRNIGTFKISAGGFAGTLQATRKIVAISLTGGDLAATITAPAIGPIRVLKDANQTGGNVIDSVIAALKIGSITIDGNLTNSKILAGLQMGADGLLGGSGEDSDSFNAGSLGAIRIGGNVVGSILGAGYTPFDAVFGDANDGIFGGNRSKIGRILIGGTLDTDSRIGAGVFRSVKINGIVVKPRNDPAHFVIRRYKKGTIPPDPLKVAPSLSNTVATNLFDAAIFLTKGRPPIQSGIVPGTIKPEQIAVLRGRVLNRGGTPLGTVEVTVLNRPEFGETHTREDGAFDMAVNGGTPLVLAFEKDGFSAVQRRVQPAQQDYTSVEDVTMVTLDPMMTEVPLGTATPMVFHEASVQDDASGMRRATLMFQPETIAMALMPNGTSEPLSTIHVRATEFTVGTDGPAAMPGVLPPNSAYTYCVNLTADEAIDLGASNIVFTKPVFLYVENFLHMTIGIEVPSGFYNKEKGQWEGGPSGRVIKILSVTNDLADLDVDGDGNADLGAPLATLSITEEERGQLASRFAAGQSIWRVPIPHFSPWDCNWPYGPPPDAEPPSPPPPKSDNPPDTPDDPPNVYLQTQSMGETVPLAGTPLTLNYRSERVAGRTAAGRLLIPLSTSTLPGPVKRIELEISVAGRSFRQEFPASTNLSSTFEWDGLDAYERPVLGRQTASTRIGYVYDGDYQRTNRFGVSGNGIVVTGDRTRQEITLSTTNTAMIGTFDIRRQSLGGWTFDAHHTYDPVSRRLFLGDGTQRSVQAVSSIVRTTAGTGLAFTPGFENNGIPATQAKLGFPWGIASAADGSTVFSDPELNRIFRLGTDGILHVIAGTGSAGYNGDEQTATTAQISSPLGLDLAPDGTIYFCDFNNHRVRSITPDGMIHTLAGTGVEGAGGDNGPATQAQLRQPIGIHVGPDLTIYIADGNNQKVRAVGTDGTMRLIAGTGSASYNGDNIQATTADLFVPQGVAADRDGNVYISDTGNRRVRRVGPDGIITTYAGNGTLLNDPMAPAGDGGPASQAQLHSAESLDVAPDGTLLIADPGARRIRKVTRDGIINTVAGSGGGSSNTAAANGENGPALQASIGNQITNQGAQSAIFGSDGAVLIAEGPNRRIRKVDAPLPGFSGGDLSIPSEDGLELYRFDSSGRHLATLHAFTGTTIYRFDYDGDGQLVKVTDGAGSATTVQRTAGGAPTAIIGPFGHKTLLQTDAGGNLTRIQDPLGGAWQFSYGEGGLLTKEIDPTGNTHSFAYDDGGRLTEGDHAGPSFTTLSRAEVSNGYEVTVESALGATGTYTVERSSTGGQSRTNLTSTGFLLTRAEVPNGRDTETTPDGTITTLTHGPDPRFGMQAPIESENTFVTPGGKTVTLTTTRATTLSDPLNPLSLTAFSETLNVNGADFAMTFAPATRTFLNTSAEGRTSGLTIDALGRATSIQQGNLTPMKLSYSARSRLTSLTTGTGAATRETKFAYNTRGELTSITDPLSKRWIYTYDAAGRVATRQQPDGGTLAFAYDAAGNIVSVTPPGKPTHSLTFAENGLIATHTAPNAGSGDAVTTFAYNAHNALTQVTRPGNETIVYGYDSGGRVTSRAVAAGTTIFAYHPTTGALTSITQPNGDAVGHTYDGPFELTSTWTGTIAGSVARSLDASARTDTQTVNSGGGVTFTYDADWLLVGAGPLSLTRDLERGLVASTNLGGVSDSRSFNEFGEFENYSANFSGTPLLSLTHSHDKNGRVVQSIETIGAGPSDSFTYFYDAVGRLTEVKKNGATHRAYSYDTNGNRLTADGITSTYDAQDRLLASGATTFTYKASGDLLTKSTGGQTTTYTYDALGNLTAVALPGGPDVSYVIDGHNRRIGRKVNGTLVQGFLYQDALNIVGELDGSNQLVSRFVYADRDDSPAFMFKGGVTYRIIADQIGSPRLVVNTDNGAIAQRLDYDAFGNVLLDTNPGFQPFGFAGGLYDPTTKLVRFGARDYDPAVGRWTTKDPLFFAGHETNLYAYASNDPLNVFDPEGRDIVSVGIYQAVIVPGHTSISVNGSPFQGFYPDNGGTIVFEGKKLQRNPNYRVRFKVTPEQAKRIKKFLEDQKKSGRKFDLFTSNCAHFVRDALEAGGVVHKGRGFGYSPSQLFRELLFGGGNFTF